MTLEGAAGPVILPPGRLNKRTKIPGYHEHVPLEFALGKPRVRQGQ